MQEGLSEAIANCDQEPIHALGSIQPHGALLCLDAAGRLLAASATASQWLGCLPALGTRFDERHFDATARQLLTHALQHPQEPQESTECGRGGDTHVGGIGLDGGDKDSDNVNDNADDNASGNATDKRTDNNASLAVDGTLSGTQIAVETRFDLVVHWSGDVLIAEWEQIAPDAPSAGHYAVLAQRAIQRLQERDHDAVEALIQDAVEAVRTMTGFDRVMGYRFLQDDSGEVIAEARRDDLSPFLHQRYPAGDIPAQARRLYVLHPIRQIVSVAASPVTIQPSVHPMTGQVFDLSHSILRSVSPIHIEYLTNMGVGASMSISIVINGRLWGLIACHHMREYRVPLAVRLSCTVLTQVLSILIERTEFKRRMEAEARANALSQEVAHCIEDASDLATGMMAASEPIRQLVECDSLAVLIDQRVVFSDAASPRGLFELAQFMSDRHIEKVVAKSIDEELPDLPRPLTRSGEAAGLLAIQVVAEARITVIWLRDELVETIRWAGPPGKVVASGPNGRRLTPRGSFEVWQQTVRGSGREWQAIDRTAARGLKAVFQDVALERLRESDRERMTLLATLGHDLRDPLQAINLAVQLMGKGVVSSTDTAKRVEGSTRRMQSLISYILDVSRIRSGIGLGLERRPTSMDTVLHTMVDEMRFTYPAIRLELQSDMLGMVDLDEDRFAQGLSNLLSNARQHGDTTAPIVIEARRLKTSIRIAVRNRMRQRPSVPFRRLIDPFKGGGLNLNNRSGLGLGLFIANAIFTGHDARFDAEFGDQDACFVVTFDVAEHRAAA